MGAKKLNQRTEPKDIVVNGVTVLHVVTDDEKNNSFENNQNIEDVQIIEDQDELKKEMEEFLNKKAEEQAKPEIKKFLSVEDKIQKIKELNILTERRQNLIVSKNTLSEFALGTTTEAQKLELIDSNNRKFNIQNTEAIKGVIDYLKNFLSDKVKEVENQINFE